MGAGLIEVTLELLEEVLGVPDDVRITGVEAYDSIRQVARFRVEGSGLPECAEGCTPTIVDLQS